MAKILQGKLPNRINVVVNRKIIDIADFGTDGIYETDNEDVIWELKEYGYEVEETEKPATQEEEIDKPIVSEDGAEVEETEKPRNKRNKRLD